MEYLTGTSMRYRINKLEGGGVAEVSIFASRSRLPKDCGLSRTSVIIVISITRPCPIHHCASVAPGMLLVSRDVVAYGPHNKPFVFMQARLLNISYRRLVSHPEHIEVYYRLLLTRRRQGAASAELIYIDLLFLNCSAGRTLLPIDWPPAAVGFPYSRLAFITHIRDDESVWTLEL